MNSKETCASSGALLVESGRLGSCLVVQGVGADWDVDLDVSRGYDGLFATCDGCHDGGGRSEGKRRGGMGTRRERER